MLLIIALVVGALMMAAALESSVHAWLAWFALVPLFFVIRLWRPATAILGGALWGLLIYLFSAADPAAAVTSNLQALVLLAAIPAIYAGIGAAVTRWIGFNPFVLGFAWMGAELALSPTGIRAGLLGAVPVQGTIMQWVGGALGYVLVAFLVALVSASLVTALTSARLSLPQRSCRVLLARRGAVLSPQASFCSSLVRYRPSRPRAPPAFS